MKLLEAFAIVFCVSLFQESVCGKAFNNRCNKLSAAFIELRDDLFRNSILSHMMQSDSIESHLEENLGVDIDDNEAVHDLCCRVVACKSPSELASLLDVDTMEVEQYLWIGKNAEDFYTEYFEKLKTEMRSLHTWLIESGFPDEWPVNTSLNVNEEFLKKNDIVTIFVTFSHDTLTDFEVAAALTEANSLTEYVEELEPPEIDETALQHFLVSDRELATDTELESVLKGLDTYLKFLITIGDLKLGQ